MDEDGREMKMMRRFASLLLRKGWPRTHGRIVGLPLEDDVEIARDQWGIPHITARSMHDLLLAQGYVHAQDRLWQMETLRRLTLGRLSEIAGERAVPLDWFSRMIGLPEMKRRAAAGLSDEERGHCQAYADGVNACVRGMGRRLPLEFASLKLSPDPWSAEDCTSVLPYLAFTQMFWPYAEKLLAVARAGRVTEEEWNDMFPSSPGAQLPHDDWFDRAPGLKFGAILPGALAFHGGLTGKHADPALLRSLLGAAQAASGSNNWAVAEGEDGKPILANDPHLGLSVPAIWYFCHLHIRGAMNVAGTTIAGTPGIVIGRTGRAAWAVTNVMMDAADVLTFRVDPEDPLRYFTPEGARRMRQEDVVIRLSHGRSVTLPLYRTEKGPVVTSLVRGVNAAAVMRWYGTIPDGAPEDRSLRGVFAFMKAASATDVLEAAGNLKYVSMNFVAADLDGHIAWHASGAAPLRRGYSGRLPGDASAGADWDGFLPFEAMPSMRDPARGYIVTANYRPESYDGPALSHIWCAPYRCNRINDALRHMRRPGVEEFRRLQMDVHSGQADRILPALERLPLSDPGAREAVLMLAGWDREVRAESAAAAVFEVFLTQLIRCLLSDTMGDDLDLYFNALSYAVENEILEKPRSPFWNDDMIGTVTRALVNTMAFCASEMGPDRRRWSWGRLHYYSFRHPGASGRLKRWLLNPPRVPAHGDCSTINVSWSNPGSGSYRVTTIPSMRMVATLGDPDGLFIIGPLGQSGQPGHRHYEDLTDRWREGHYVRVPLTEDGVRAVTRERLVLAGSSASA
jgi:penicillin amidase